MLVFIIKSLTQVHSSKAVAFHACKTLLTHCGTNVSNSLVKLEVSVFRIEAMANASWMLSKSCKVYFPGGSLCSTILLSKDHLVQCRMACVNRRTCGIDSCIRAFEAESVVSFSSIKPTCTFAKTASSRNKCQRGGRLSFVNDPEEKKMM